jgi:two-component system sensor histidine kinase BarA
MAKPTWHRLLKLLRLRPLSLERKCQLTFGVAVVFTLVIALLLPYIWMRQLTKKASLDARRAEADTLLRQHYQLKTWAGLDVNSPDMRLVRFTENNKQLQQLTDKQKVTIESLKAEEGRNEVIIFEEKDDVHLSQYVRILRATDSCLSCHNSQGTANAFSSNELIGAIVIQRPAGEISRTNLLNWVWICVAGLIAGTGAIVAFYWITQRVILRPIRQLRAIANNVAEGNLDIRSSITTGDEYESLAHAFNHMLDGLQKAQEELRQANKQLDAKIAELSERNIELFKANKIKSEFLGNISHEFRTPLNAILGFAQVLREKPGILNKDKSRRYAENIITSGNRLLNMINDLLDLAKTQAGRMELHIEKTSIPELIDAAVASFSLQTKKKKIKVKVMIEPDLPTLMTDAGKVQQILYNFLSNAVKFTPELGRIEIQAGSPVLRSPHGTEGGSPMTSGASHAAHGPGPEPRTKPSPPGDPLRGLAGRFVRISVTDTGCGIAGKDKEKIFEKFRQVDGSLTRETTGSGLGLAISRELAIMLAGNIGIESEIDKGSTFWLDVPIVLTKEKEIVN